MSIPISEETKKPSLIPLLIWFIEVIIVITFTCVVIALCIIPWPPTYTITNLDFPGTLDNNNNSNYSSSSNNNNNKLSIQDNVEVKLVNSTIIISLLITNSNKAKKIIYDDSKISLYKNGVLLGESRLQGFIQSGKSNNSFVALVNVNDQGKMKFGGENEGDTLKIMVESKVRYIIIKSTTKYHFLNFEAFVPVDINGKVNLGDKGIKLEPVNHKL